MREREREREGQATQQVNGRTITTIKHKPAPIVVGGVREWMCYTYNFIILHRSFAPGYSFAWPQNVISFRNGTYMCAISLSCVQSFIGTQPFMCLFLTKRMAACAIAPHVKWVCTTGGVHGPLFRVAKDGTGIFYEPCPKI